MSERTEEVLDPSKKKEYNNIMKRYKKLFKKTAKDMRPWDWSFGLDAFVDFLKWMYEYYKLGYNVWALDVTDPNEGIHTEKTRADSLKETLMYYDRWQTCCDDYYKIAKSEEEIKHYEKLGFHVVSPKDDAIEQSMRKTGRTTLILYPDSKENVEKCDEAYRDYKHKFFECLEKYIEEWWD